MSIHQKGNKTLAGHGEEKEKGTEGNYSFFPWLFVVVSLIGFYGELIHHHRAIYQCPSISSGAHLKSFLNKIGAHGC
jgi:hypothetical protein